MIFALVAIVLTVLIGTVSGQEAMDTDLKKDENGYYFNMFQTELTVSDPTVSEQYTDYQFSFYLD